MQQAVVDIINCVFYTLPGSGDFIIWTLLKLPGKEMFLKYHITIDFSMVLSTVSSIFTFTIISVERYMAICKPLLHKSHLKRSLMWKWTTLTWLISVISALVSPILFSYSKQGYKQYMWIRLLLLGFLIIVITYLF